MTMRLRVVHTTRYSYDSPATSSYNEARLAPLTTASQTTLESRVRTDPRSSVLRYSDYWGTDVTAFDLHQPHHALEIVATSTVETAETPAPTATVGWDELRDEQVLDRYAELLAPTAYTRLDPSMAEAAAQVAAAPDPAAAVLSASAVVRDHLAYRPGATGVRTTAAEAWEARTGVCQDFAHITVALLRHCGIPARYVSGYLHPSVNPEIGATVVGESHAWVEGWVGDWLAVDPTNGAPVGERHVLVARARDYRDVSPVHGVYAGAAASRMSVTVEITRLR